MPTKASNVAKKQKSLKILRLLLNRIMFLSTPFDKMSTKQNYCMAMFNPHVVLYKAKQLLYHTILSLSHAEQSVVRIVNSLPLANEVCERHVFTPVCHSVHRGGGSPSPHPRGSCGVWLGGLQTQGVYPSMH